MSKIPTAAAVLILFCSLVSSLRAAEPLRIICIGDSITEGFKNTKDPEDQSGFPSYRKFLWDLLTEKKVEFDFIGTQNGCCYNQKPLGFGQWDMDHQSYSGATSEFVLRGNPKVEKSSLEDRLQKLSVPDLALIHLGTNDLDKVPAQTTIANLHGIIDVLRARNPRITIFLAQIIPMWRQGIPELNQAIAALGKEASTTQSPVFIVDQHTGFDSTKGVDTYDGVHPNQQGQQKMATRWYQALDPYLKARSR